MLARAYLGLGEVDRALEVAREAVETSDKRQTVRCACVARLSLSQVLRAAHGKDAADEIKSVLDRVADDLLDSGANLYMPRLHEERGELALLREDHASFEIEFQAAHELDVEMGSEARARRLAERLESEAESWDSRTRAGSSGRRS